MDTKNSRRNFLQKTAVLTASTFVGATIFSTANASVKKKTDILDLPSSLNDTYTLPKLNYSYDALEPHFDK